MKPFAQLLAEIEGFQWDAGNQTKNWDKHRVSTREAEQVFFNSPLLVSQDIKHSDLEERFGCFGQTDEGRRLFLVFMMRARQIRVISARNMSRRERRMYEKEGS